MKKKQNVPLVALTIGIYGVLFFISHNAAWAQAADSYQIKFGVILPLSGPLAEYGIAVRNGMEMARAENPTAYRFFEMFYEDSRYDSKMVISAFHKLRNINHVDLVYVWGGGPSDALAPIANQQKVPTLLHSFDPKTAAGKEYAIQYHQFADPYGQALVDYFKSRSWKQLVVIKTELSYFNFIYDAIMRLTKDSDISISLESVPADEMHFASLIARLKKGRYDAVGVFLLSGQSSQFLLQADQQKLNLPVFGTDFFESKTEIRASKGLMSGAVYPQNHLSADFRKVYFDTYGNDLQITFGGQGHDVMEYCRVALDNLGAVRLKPEELVAKFRAVKTFDGVSGHYTRHRDASGTYYYESPVVLRIIDGEEIRDLTSVK